MKQHHSNAIYCFTERLHRTRFKKLAKAAYGKNHQNEGLLSRKIFSWWKFILAQEYSDDSALDVNIMTYLTT